MAKIRKLFRKISKASAKPAQEPAATKPRKRKLFRKLPATARRA